MWLMPAYDSHCSDSVNHCYFMNNQCLKLIWDAHSPSSCFSSPELYLNFSSVKILHINGSVQEILAQYHFVFYSITSTVLYAKLMHDLRIFCWKYHKLVQYITKFKGPAGLPGQNFQQPSSKSDSSGRVLISNTNITVYVQC